MQSFLQRYGSRIHGVLHGWDRLRFRGTLRALAFNRGRSGFLFALGVAFKNFQAQVEGTTQQLRQATYDLAQAAGRPLAPFPHSDQEAQARAIAQRDGITTGLIGIFSATESCFSYEVRPNGATKKLDLRMRPRKCLHYYHDHLHPQFGLLHRRLQTWFPFTIQIGLNGRDWLARQLTQHGLAFTQRGNCLLDLGDLAAAPRLADQQLATDGPSEMALLARQDNPAHDAICAQRPQECYWSVEQSAWALDIYFREAADLAQLYPQLLHHGIEHLACADMLRFLGRKEAGTSELQASQQTRREGVRLKHWLNGNSIKMYDKQASVLRVETTLNDATDFRAYRTKEGAPAEATPAWLPLRQGVADLPR